MLRNALKHLLIVLTVLTVLGGVLPSGVESVHKLTGHTEYLHADSTFDRTLPTPPDSGDQQSNDASANCAEGLNCLHNLACMPAATSWSNSASGSGWLAISVNKMNDRVCSPELSPPIIAA